MNFFPLAAYFNPYSNLDFAQFIAMLGKRIIQFAGGQLSSQSLASDEIQMLVLIGIAISSALVGTFLVLKRLTMLANALSHTILVGIVIAFILTRNLFIEGSETYGINMESMLIAAVATGLLTTFLTEFLTKTLKLQEDASIGLVFTTLFAVGIILVTLFTRNAHIGTEIVMGNVDSLQLEDLGLVWSIVVINILLITVFYKEYLLTTFDQSLARSLGFSATFFNYLLMIQVSATTIGAFRAVGVLMVLSFIVGPVLMARLLTHHLRSMLFISVIIGVLASIVGVALSRHILSVHQISLSTGGVVVCTLIALFLTVLIFAPEQGILFKYLLRKKWKHRINQ